MSATLTPHGRRLILLVVVITAVCGGGWTWYTEPARESRAQIRELGLPSELRLSTESGGRNSVLGPSEFTAVYVTELSAVQVLTVLRARLLRAGYKVDTDNPPYVQPAVTAYRDTDSTGVGVTVTSNSSTEVQLDIWS